MCPVQTVTHVSGRSQYSPDIIALRLNQRPRQTLGFETLVSRLQAGFALDPSTGS